jgi:transposase
MTRLWGRAPKGERIAEATPQGHWKVLTTLGAGIRERIESCGARLIYLPPYSPDLNPIEKAWSKFKQFLRTAKARTADALDQAITEALKTITADNAAAWFRHCGYGIQ